MSKKLAFLVSKLALAATLALAMALTFSCSSDDGNGGGAYLPGGGTSSPSGGGDGNSVFYQGKTYKIVQIGSQIWMAENLNYNVPGSKCGDESTGTYTDANTTTCDTYGRMYSWATAMGIDARYNNEEWGGSDVNHQGICPPGWRIPSDADWTKLTNSAGGESVAAAKLKSKTRWNSYEGQSGNGTDIYEFAALPCCRGTPSGSLTDVGDLATWWSATENGDDGATIRRMSYENTNVDKDNPKKKVYLYSVRCMKDGSISPPSSSSRNYNRDGEVPSSIIPPAIRNEIEKYMTIYSGVTPPDISGQYMMSSPALVGSSISGDALDNLADLYIAFVKSSNGKISYREEQGNSHAGSDNVVVEVVGSGNEFTAYFETVGESSGIMTKTATLISGTLTSGGISNIRYAFVLLEKGPDPTNELIPVNTYRVFKDGDGLAARNSWLASVSSSSAPRSSSSVARSSSSLAVASSSSVPRSSSSSSVVASGCGDEYIGVGGTGCDISGYRTVVIGSQTWMAENLNCDVPNNSTDVCNDNNPANCEKYGRLYDWTTAMALPSKCNSILSTSDADCAIKTPNHQGICPAGWHIPSHAEWQTLVDLAGGDEIAGTKLKAESGWCNYNGQSGNGTDDHRFSALPGGYGGSGGSFGLVGYDGNWWSATEYSASGVHDRGMENYSSKAGNSGYFSKSYLFSVRCVQD